MAVAMTNDLEQRAPAGTLISKVQSDEYTREQIQAVLPPTVRLATFSRATVTALMQNPELAKADEVSLFQSIVKCATDGLLPNGVEAALVVYNTKVKDDQGERWVAKVQYLPMIAGVRKIAAEYGWTIRTHVVYANDLFEVEQGTDDRITHRPALGADRGDLVAAYAIAHHRDGRRSITEVMTEQDIEKARNVSKAKDRGPWKDWTAQMWEKTVGHRIAKKLPLDPVDAKRLSNVIEASELAPGEAARMLYGNRAIVASEVGALSEGEQGTSHVPPADSETAVGGQGASTDGTPAAADLHDDEPVPGEPAEDAGEPEIIDEGEDEQARQLADSAAMFIPPNGQYAQTGKLGPKSLSEILATGDDGERWLKWALGKITAPQDYCDAVQRFTRVYLPAAYQEALARKQAAS